MDYRESPSKGAEPWSFRSDFGPVDETRAAMRSLATACPDFVDLSETNPTRVGLELPPVPFACAEEAQNYYAPDCRGLEPARRAIAHLYRRRTRATPEDVRVTASTSEAYSHLLHLLCDPGDAVLVPRPSYPLFDHLAQLAGVRLVSYRLAYDGSWYLDRSSLPSPERLRQLGVRAVVAISPNNPTGSCLSCPEWGALSELGVPLLVDEVFRLYPRGRSSKVTADTANADAVSPADPLIESEVPVFIIDGLSKRAILPGLKLAWILASGRDRAGALDRLDHINDAYLSASSLVQASVPEILKHEQARRRPVQERIALNETTLASALEPTCITLLRLEAGWTALLRLPAVATEDEFGWELAKRGVWAHQGGFYDLPWEPCLAVSLLTPPELLMEGVRRLLEVAERLGA